MFLVELSNGNLISGSLPESLGLLLFGGGLIVLTVVIRWIFRHFEEKAD